MTLESCKTLNRDSPDGAGSTINPRSILWMRIEKAEAPWSGVRFKSKRQTHQGFIEWVHRLLPDSEIAEMFNEVGIKKALT